MKRRYTAAFIAVMIAGSLFAGCGSTARDNVASKEKDINKEQVATKAIAYEETFEKVTQKTDSENNKQTESNQQDANASDSSDNKTDAGQADIGTDNDNVQENSQNSEYQDDASQDDSYQDNGSGYGSESDDNGGSSDAGENSDDSSSGESANVIDDESLLAIAKINTVTYSEFANRVLELVNIERANAGVAPLVLDEALCNAANMRAIEMDRTGEFSHTRPGGRECFTVVDYCNIGYMTCGENIAAGQPTPEDVVNGKYGWMSSAGHKANILSPEYTKMGLGYSTGGGGEYRHYWAQEFAG